MLHLLQFLYEEDFGMIGLGTVINSVSIVIGGLLGVFFGKFFKESQQDALNKACGISVLFIGIAGQWRECYLLTAQKLSA